ncbi:MAG: DMT family transporter [Acidobacteriota bacterium]|nr:MAG: DMT family transporter [Acidobacteriota bacterium]
MSATAQESGALRVYGALVLVQVFFGLHYLAAKRLLVEIHPQAWALMRVAAAAGLLLLLARLAGRRWPRRGADYARLAWFSLFGVVINQICFVEGLSRTTPTHSAIINTMIPVLTLSIAVLLRREALTGWKIVALVLALAGALLVVNPQRAAEHPASVAGDLITLVNATSFSFFLVISKRLLTRTDPLVATALLFAFGTLGVGAVGAGELLAIEPRAISPLVWWLALFIVVFPTAGAYLLNYWALARVDSSMVALFIYLQPVLAAALSALVFGERPGADVLAGAALIFAGVFLAVRRPRGSP